MYVNDVYIPFLHANQFTQIFFGGASSGKSFFLAQRCIMEVVEGEGTNYLICRNVARTIRKSVFNEVCKAIARVNLSWMFSINKSDLVITCKTNHKQILFAGLDDVEKLKSITPEKGVIEAIWIEEATETQRSAYLQLKKRLRGFSAVAKKIILSFNPVLKTHWIYKEFFAEWDESKNLLEKDRLLILKTTYKDNHFLTDEDIYQLENEADEYFREVYTYGNWGILGNIIYRNWKTQDLAPLRNAFNNVYNGLDFGFTNPNAGVRIHVSVKQKILYVFDEYYQPHQTHEQLAQAMHSFVGTADVICDNEDPQGVFILCTNGINARAAKKGADSVMSGIKWIQDWKIVVDIHCQNFINEIRQYHLQQDKDGNAIDKPVKVMDHLMDAMRYALEPLYLYGEATAGKRT